MWKASRLESCQMYGSSPYTSVRRLNLGQFTRELTAQVGISEFHNNCKTWCTRTSKFVV